MNNQMRKAWTRHQIYQGVNIFLLYKIQEPGPGNVYQEPGSLITHKHRRKDEHSPGI
jgi:hypothetical protein